MTQDFIFFKNIATQKVERRQLAPSHTLHQFLSENGNPEYVLVPTTESQYDDFFEALTLENGVLGHDMDAVKAIAHIKRKAKIEVFFKPYDKIISDINAIEIPEEYFPDGYTTAKDDAEAKRAEIRTMSALVKTDINNATTVADVLSALELLIEV